MSNASTSEIIVAAINVEETVIEGDESLASNTKDYLFKTIEPTTNVT